MSYVVKPRNFVTTKLNDFTYCVCQRTRRGDRPYTQEEMDSALMNQAPGAPNLSVMSFKGGLHGRTMCKYGEQYQSPVV